MNKHEIEVYILDLENASTYISLIRKFSKESIMEMKRKISCKEPIITCQYTKMPEELKELYNLLESLIDKGAKIKIIQNIQNKVIKEIDMDIISNLIQRRKEINQEVTNSKDLEVKE